MEQPKCWQCGGEMQQEPGGSLYCPQCAQQAQGQPPYNPYQPPAQPPGQVPPYGAHPAYAQQEILPQRGGCLSAFLIMVMVVNPMVSIVYFLAGDWVAKSNPGMPGWAIPLLALFGLFNAACAVAIWRWKRWGVYGFVASAVVALTVNLASGIPPTGAMSGLVGVIILIALVRPIWDHLT